MVEVALGKCDPIDDGACDYEHTWSAASAGVKGNKLKDTIQEVQANNHERLEDLLAERRFH
jgi:hypothetical protein